MTNPNQPTAKPGGNYVGGNAEGEQKHNYDAGAEPVVAHPEPRVAPEPKVNTNIAEDIRKGAEAPNAVVEKAVKEEPAKPERKFAKQVEYGTVHDPMVKARVTKKGADKISTGRHEPGLGDEYFAAGEIIDVLKTTADDLEDRGFVEIQD